MKEAGTKLHIGCGSVIMPGWVNVDVRKIPGVDIIDDVTELSCIPDDSCDIIYACHILEHVSRHETAKTLALWKGKLVKGGTLRLAVPDFAKVVKRYQSTNDISECIGLISGGQKNDYDHHFMVFDKASLTKHLEQVGFSNITEWDWRTVDHCDIDDHSQSYLPHMDKDHGLLMSLNLEATK